MNEITTTELLSVVGLGLILAACCLWFLMSELDGDPPDDEDYDPF